MIFDSEKNYRPIEDNSNILGNCDIISRRFLLVLMVTMEIPQLPLHHTS